ncbi:phenylalanine--tRNA ligase subunit alpha [Spiroplasma sp. AdecLV25b]|uniref:phenylalanine--tRNA ligase subunit alpha n=1 Tax=Spiroplasma sp. AdecLV25b TaxID=3027162 RepID=UPI0027DFD579|nr:phenylalanine--tRNA ligase subunit alpha [Spiroplasma sp. AdecLV25b]
MLEVSDLRKKLDIIRQQAFINIEKINDLYELQVTKTQYLGKNSAINDILKSVTQLPHQYRIEIGQLTNKLKKEISDKITIKFNELEKKVIDEKLKDSEIDLTLPGLDFSIGHRNPLLKTVDDIANIFKNLGYQIVSGNEVENEEYNFNRLNLPANHPARAMQDTFYLDNNSKEVNRWLLRTHATNITARILSKQNKNKQKVEAVISLGNVYRKDNDDATHSHQFMQVDGFVVAPNITFANLKWTLNHFCQQMFGLETKTRLRPSYFPFTEPSVEVDVNCPMCKLQGCSLCKHTGWIEVLGAGMIHPNVFTAAGLDEATAGFAFGVGIERIAMIKYGIDDIRLFYNNDLRFLKQF